MAKLRKNDMNVLNISSVRKGPFLFISLFSVLYYANIEFSHVKYLSKLL